MAAGVVAVAPSSAEAGGTRATRGARGAPPAHRSHATRGAHRAANQDLVVVGAGEGHGVGMSQWGAYGYARRGWGYAAILSHYYSSTSLGQTSSTRVVRVLLAGNRGSLTFTGATHAGRLALSSGQSYTALRSGTAAVSLRDARGHTLATLAAPLRVTGPGPLTLAGRADNGVSNGAYRGDLELSPGRHGGINAVDAVALEDYVRGVVAEEADASWPVAALEAQAVATRTYAITATVGHGLGFDQYSDTRSQQYGGVSGERASTDRAVSATRDQVVTYGGRPAITYFCASSGGRTADVQSAFPGAAPEPWLRSVDDPYEGFSPRHRWGPYRFSPARAASMLGGLLHGRLRAITIIRRDASGRVLAAQVVGTSGSTAASGLQLQSRLELPSTWASFTVGDQFPARPVGPSSRPSPPPSAASTSAGTTASIGGGVAAP